MISVFLFVNCQKHAVICAFVNWVCVNDVCFDSYACSFINDGLWLFSLFLCQPGQ